jgi:DNA-binding PadR family transcriptional regulator
VFATDRWDQYAVVQSTIHEVWARKYSGALKQDLRYSPSDCFGTFAFPAGQWQQTNEDLATIGERYHEFRRDLMLRLWLGLTDIYNLFHAPDLDARLAKLFTKREKSPDWQAAASVPPEHRATAGTLTPDQAHDAIHHLRTLHRELDYTVLEAYGWAPKDWRTANGEQNAPSKATHASSSFIPQPSPLVEIVLSHGFYAIETLPENDRTRYTITPASRKELLTRLLQLNHQRAAEEQNAALVTATTSKGRKVPKQRTGQEDDLFAAPLRTKVEVPALPSSPRISLASPEKFLLVFANEFLDHAADRSDFKTLNRTFHLLRHREARQSEIVAAIGSIGGKWVEGFNDDPPNHEFIPFLKRLEKDGWIEVDRSNGTIRKTARFPLVPGDEWRSFDVRASLQVLSKQAEIIDLSSEEENQAAIDFAEAKTA